MSHKTHRHEGGESYRGVVPAKQPNEGRGGPKEVVEERPRTKENMEEPNSNRTPSRGSEPSGLDRVRQAAKRDGKMRFTALLHHVTVDLLRDSYRSLEKRAAAGVDGATHRRGHKILDVIIALVAHTYVSYGDALSNTSSVLYIRDAFHPHA